MNKFFKSISLIAVLALVATACGPQTVQADSEMSVRVVGYQAVLGKSLSDETVINFIAGNNCSTAEKFQLCKDAGIALWVGSDQIVKTVYLYAGHADGFGRYRGALPFGLTFYDPMWRVEEKLSTVDADDTSQTPPGFGLPEEGSTPDHFHYWAIYERFGMIVIYDTPFADEDAYIYAIVINT